MNTKTVQYSLWASLPFNLIAAFILAFPSSAAGQLVDMPSAVPRIYSFSVAYLVLLFAGAYGWLASQPEINRPLLTMSAIGKAGIFFLFLALYFAKEAKIMMVFVASGDLAFASVWFFYLFSSAPKQSDA